MYTINAPWTQQSSKLSPTERKNKWTMAQRQFNSVNQYCISQLLVRLSFLFNDLTLGSSLKPRRYKSYSPALNQSAQKRAKQCALGTGPQIFRMILPKFSADIIHLGTLAWGPCISFYYQDFLLKLICMAVDSASIGSSPHTWGLD